ncbi:MAG: AIR synthase family protein [Candidatus Thorarchaeota archaeon]
MPILRTGKVPLETLKKFVFPYLGSLDSEVIHGPGVGRDAALVKIGRNVVVASTDPITGAIQNIGAYTIQVCANDIATFGVRPRWFLVTILLPENSEETVLHEIMTSMHSAAESLHVKIIGGHTEVTPDLARPILVGFMLGITTQDSYVTSEGAQPGNKLILTKGVGIEGTSILATERAEDLCTQLDNQLVKNAKKFINQISVVPEALIAMETGGVTAMHDPTEGGIANGLHELAEASRVGFRINRDALVIHKETREICRILDTNPLNLIASGAMLISVKGNKANQVLEKLQQKEIPAAIIGETVKDISIRNIVEPDGNETLLVQPIEDALWTALKKPVPK